MVKINKKFIPLIIIAFISVSCNGEEYEKYLTDHQLLEVAKIELKDFMVHVAINKNEYKRKFMFINDALDLSCINIIFTKNAEIKDLVVERTFNGRQPIFENGKEILLACTDSDSERRLIIYYDKIIGLKKFLIDYNKINQLIYFKGKIYTTWDKSIDYLRIIDVETGEIITPKTNPLFYGDLFISNNRLYAVNYDYEKRKYTEIYEIKGNDLIPYKGKRFEIPKVNQPTLDDYLINK